MNKKLQEYIKNLSIKDKKTLSQKALKVSEETGELARVTLPFDNAHGTTHRFIEKERVLEESVDVMLTAISMAYELGYTHNDIEDMMWRKAKKWQGIQLKEEKVDYPIPYEIHITVDISKFFERLYRLELEDESGRTAKINYKRKSNKKLEEQSIDYFKRVCEEIGVKPIVLDLENDGKSVMKDVMTSSHIVGNNVTAYSESKRIEAKLIQAELDVVRVKIETVPWHPAAPSKMGDEMPEDCYFEAHIGCIITLNEKRKIKEIAKSFGAHLSRNFFKKIDKGSFVNMITLRRYDGLYESFEIGVKSLTDSLDSNGVKYEKVITEFSIYDTKVSHDFKWIENKK